MKLDRALIPAFLGTVLCCAPCLAWQAATKGGGVTAATTNGIPGAATAGQNHAGASTVPGPAVSPNQIPGSATQNEAGNSNPGTPNNPLGTSNPGAATTPNQTMNSSNPSNGSASQNGTANGTNQNSTMPSSTTNPGVST